MGNRKAKTMKPSDYIKRGWTQGAFARRKNGDKVLYNSPEAVRWCVRGAINAACPDRNRRIKVRELLEKHIGTENILDWNDEPGRKKSEVIAALEAIGE